MDSDSKQAQSNWARFALNNGALKRAFPGGMPNLDEVSVTRCLIEDHFFIVNVHLFPLPATVANEWIKRKYDRVDLRFVFRDWSVIFQSGSIRDLIGRRRVVLESGLVTIDRLESDGTMPLLVCDWKDLDVKTLPDVLEAQLVKDRDINDTDIRPVDRQ